MCQQNINRSQIGEFLLERLNLAGQPIIDAGAYIGFQYDTHAGSHFGHRVDGSLHDVHDLVPRTLDRGEHRVSVVRKPTGANHLHGPGDHARDPFPDAQRCDGERDDHDIGVVDPVGGRQSFNGDGPTSTLYIPERPTVATKKLLIPCPLTWPGPVSLTNRYRGWPW